MFLIEISLIGLIAIGALTILTPLTKTSAEYVPVPVRVDKAYKLRQSDPYEAEILNKKF